MKVDLGNRVILEDGTVVCSETAAVELLYQGKDLSDILIDSSDEVQLFNETNRLLDYGFETVSSGNYEMYGDVNWFSAWTTPENYRNIDVLEYCLNRCSTDEQRSRVNLEYKMFEERNMIPVLRHLIWMVDDFRSRNILWGVGRGSSVSSYILHLIGINRIDPLKYNLDIGEFLK